ncbi:MAG: TlpA family protein disulfide reductase [Bacteroidetes Order II. Incertae sedis bacterium]|jgi:thiol-disulfide isomerase/thioredoxin|nr:TlpA family protein disulfide reductase [Bacteroidetes Order II. bacterium]MBT4052962.1 TlpA family protein disulfide reductase [Bacteroidetes Order II. bacterium]MBT4603080.1 TlpA family protein disulfide reductase [Bacteroidetes Order II. bacterium]MBT5250717.1 TlpA family protein disulfide reductase [Bacteroidetes Order II. bacterium]MBT6425810.1 TlpA family protein disulfide reductase [Bacteroidetes Order II. bacterium]
MSKSDENQAKRPKRSWKRTALEWAGLLAVIAFFRYTDQGTVVQSWLQRGLLATGIMQADVRYAENHDEPANFNLKLTTLEGEPALLSDYRGKVIFLNFWATWCPPCLAEMPFIQSLYEDVASEDIVFVMVSTDEEVETAQRFIEAKGYTLPIYRLAGRVPAQYDVRTLPTTYVISPSGNMATVHVGMANYNTRGFRKFLKQMSVTGVLEDI